MYSIPTSELYIIRKIEKHMCNIFQYIYVHFYKHNSFKKGKKENEN